MCFIESLISRIDISSHGSPSLTYDISSFLNNRPSDHTEVVRWIVPNEHLRYITPVSSITSLLTHTYTQTPRVLIQTNAKISLDVSSTLRTLSTWRSPFVGCGSSILLPQIITPRQPTLSSLRTYAEGLLIFLHCF